MSEAGIGPGSDACGCDPAAASEPVTANPAGQSLLRRRVAVHATSLARMRAELGAPHRSLELRALARQGTDDPILALLDTWAVVADVVAFYSERIAHEGLLRTATERRSVRELARTLGYELRPGVAAQVELAFSAHMVEGSPEVVTVPRGTPVQSIPGPGELPQVFETTDALEVRGAWNEIAGISAAPQPLAFAGDTLWLRGSSTTVRPGDAVLVVSSSFITGPSNRDVRTVTEVVSEPDGRTGWTQLSLDEPIGGPIIEPGGIGKPTAGVIVDPGDSDVPGVHAFADRTALFGWNAPDPNLLVVDGVPPAGSEPVDPTATTQTYQWIGFPLNSSTDPDVEVDGDHKGLLPRTWMVLEQPGLTHTYRVVTADPDAATKFALSNKLTRVQVDSTAELSLFDRRRATVHCASTRLPADEKPLTAAAGGGSLVLETTDPPLPPGRLVLVTGTDSATGEQVTETATVVTCTPLATGTMTATFAAELGHTYEPDTLRVRGNVAVATHGETVEQVLGSGDGRVAFPRFRPRRTPLTYVRAQTPDGARAELTVRVDGVAWSEVPSLEPAGPQDRVYSVAQDEDGAAQITMGDGAHGARLPTGAENVIATYRAGIGVPGAVAAGQASLLVRRPLGIRDVVNPAAAHDWAPAETLEEARVNAPLRVRTLDRAVSVTDFEDFARGFAGIGRARGDLVWDGRVSRVALTLLGTGGVPVSDALLGDLRAALDAARDPSAALDLVHGEVLWFAVRVEITRDPAHAPDVVDAAVSAALEAAFAPTIRTFAAPVAAASALVVVRGVPGVLACTMPRLLPLAGPGTAGVPPVLPPDDAARDPLTALPGRAERGVVVPAQLLGIAAGGVDVTVMAP